MHSSGGCADVSLVHRHDAGLVLALLLREHVHRVGGIVIIAVQILWQKKINILYKIVPGVRAGDTLHFLQS